MRSRNIQRSLAMVLSARAVSEGTCKSNKLVTNYKKKSMNQEQVEVKVNYLNFLLFIQLIVFWNLKKMAYELGESIDL